MGFRNNLIHCRVVCFRSHIVNVPIQDNFKKCESERNQMHEAPQQRNKPTLADSDLDRFMEAFPSRMPKCPECMDKEA